jgi:hypothetical protein
MDTIYCLAKVAFAELFPSNGRSAVAYIAVPTKPLVYMPQNTKNLYMFRDIAFSGLGTNWSTWMRLWVDVHISLLQYIKGCYGA